MQELPSMNPTRIAIVGCGGFVGVHLVKQMLDLGYPVDGWDLEDRRLGELVGHKDFCFHHSDYSAPETIDDISKNHSVVIHLAALCNPSLYNTEDQRVIQSNFILPARLAEACAKEGSWLVYFSTSEVYGRTVSGVARGMGIEVGESNELDLLTEDSSPLLLGAIGSRRWNYACAKQLMERYLLALEVSSQLQWTVVRPFNFLGPEMDFIPGVDGEGVPRVMACFMDALLHGRSMELVDGGGARRCFTWIGDAIDGIIKILENPQASRGQCFNIGNPKNETDICGLAARMAGIYTQITGRDLPNPVWKNVSAESFYGPGYQDSDRRLPNVGKARALLGWEPRMTLDDTLRLTIDWFVQHYPVSH
jgi:UDP-apiose/xylose synthase